MTEAEWPGCADPAEMAVALAGVSSDRKFRLFGCAACRRVWKLIRDKRSREAIEASEQFADGEISEGELDTTAVWVRYFHQYPHEYSAGDSGEEENVDLRLAHAAHYCSSISVDMRALSTALDAFSHVSHKGITAERAAQADLIRDVFGNPFRPVTFDPAWLTSTVTTLASQMYESRDFGAMPILADALQDAGCDNEDVLGHCRGPGPHVRGCWVVDLVLGKE